MKLLRLARHVLVFVAVLLVAFPFFISAAQAETKNLMRKRERRRETFKAGFLIFKI